MPNQKLKEVRRSSRVYVEELKIKAVKLAREIGNSKAADELNVPKGTLGG